MSLLEMQIEDYEGDALGKLINMYAPNTPDGQDLTPNPHSSFRRVPHPIAFPDQQVPYVNPPGLDLKWDPELQIQLPWAWEATLFELAESRLYDGSSASAQKFEEATGLSPMRFAQAWCEAPHGCWRHYHLAGSGEELADALCGLWAVKIKHWRTHGEAGSLGALLRAEKHESYEHTRQMIEENLADLMSVGEERFELFQMLRHLKVLGNPDCTAHPMRTVCSCPVALAMPIAYEFNLLSSFTYAFRTRIVHCEDAFLYTGDKASATLFKVHMGGQTPAQFAQETVDMIGTGVNGM